MILKFIDKKIREWDRKHSIADVPAQEIYDTVVDYWKQISGLFSREDPRGPPIVAIDGYDYNSETEILPEKSETTHIPFYRCNAFYMPADHLIGLRRRGTPKKKLSGILAHETTHSVISVKEEAEVMLQLDDLLEFNGDIRNFGKKLHAAVKKTMDKYIVGELKVVLPEFFAPIGEVHVLGRVQDYDLRKNVFRLRYHQCLLNPWEAVGGVQNIVTHLPEFAGEILVKQYKNDVKALVREHPNLKELTGSQLWEQYCLPLLRRGKV